MANTELVILVTGFLGVPKSPFAELSDEKARYIATLNAIKKLRLEVKDTKILLAFTGDKGQFDHMLMELAWPHEDARLFAQNPGDFIFGTSLLEAKLVRNALDHWLLDSCDQYVAKLTAKYTISNLSNVLSEIRSSDCDLVGWYHYRKAMIDTRFFAFRPAVWRKFEGILNSVDDRIGFYIEHAVFFIFLLTKSKLRLLRNRPLVCGLSGSSGQSISIKWYKKILVVLGSVL